MSVKKALLELQQRLLDDFVDEVDTKIKLSPMRLEATFENGPKLTALPQADGAVHIRAGHGEHGEVRAVLPLGDFEKQVRAIADEFGLKLR